MTARLAAHLVAAGHAVEIWVHRHPAHLPAQESIGGISVRRFEMSLPAGNIGSVSRSPSATLRAMLALSRAARAFKPDLLHVQCFSVNGVYATAISRLLGIPLLVSLQGETLMDDHDIYAHSVLLRMGLRAGVRRARITTGCSQFVLDDAETRFGLAAGTGVVVPNGVDLKESSQPVPLELPFERFILAMGRVVEKKGFDLLIDAFGLLSAAHPDVGLLIGGDGAARADLQRRASELGLSERVVLPGRFTRGHVVWATKRAEAFVLPSRIEPFGIVVLEAMRAATPVIVSSRGGAQEIVRHGTEGLAVDPFDSKALARAIQSVLEDHHAARRRAAAASTRVRDFDWSLITRRYVDLYRQAT